MDLRHSKILITGASSGIGAATARAAACEGAQVILLARTSSKLEQLAADIRRDGGRASVYPVDLTDSGVVDQCAQQIMNAVGIPDVLVNNAGAGRWLSIQETQPEEDCGYDRCTISGRVLSHARLSTGNAQP